jgi:hypothetical protein
MTQITGGCDIVTRATAVTGPREKMTREERGRMRVFLSLALAAIVTLGSSIATVAQEASTPGAGGDHPAPPPLVDAPKAAGRHNFWDGENKLLFSGVAVFRALDYASTQNFMARGREETLLPDDVAKNKAGLAALEAAATGASIGLSYWMHRTGHHKLERWISIGHITVTAFGDGRNYLLKSGHHAPPAGSRR